MPPQGCGRKGAAVFRVGNPVAVTPDDQGWQGDLLEASAETGIRHRLPAVRGQAGAVAGERCTLRFGHGRGVDPETVRVVVAEFRHLVEGQV
jgi:hypothetical protein